MSVVTRATVRGKGRVYTNSLTGEQYQSVTTILGALDKPALPRWASRSVAEYVVEHGLTPIQDMTREDAIKHLSGVPWAARDKAADIGTAVHAAAEAHLRGEEHTFALPFSPGARHAMDNVTALLASLDDVEVTCLEGTVWNRSHGYAGAFDGVLRVGGETWLIDYKSSAGVYPETSLQLAGYRYGENIIDIDTGELSPMPEVDRCMIFFVPKTGPWAIWEATAGPDEFEVFLAAQRAKAWLQTSRSTVRRVTQGEPC